jgi:hypothetical protein
LGHFPDEEVLEEIARDKSPNPFVRLMGLFQHKLDLQELPLLVERARFLEITELDRVRPDHAIECSEPGCYQVIKEHIDVHKYLQQIEASSEISFDEAVGSWYDTVYLPVIQLIRDKQATDHFPDNTETDLYIWLVSRRADLARNQQAVDQALNEKILVELEQECQSKSLLHLAQHFWQKLNAQNGTMS